MIVKKIARNKSQNKASGVKNLIDYIEGPDLAKEKLLHSGGLNFISDTHDGRIAEMTALALESPGSAAPINHYVLSWQEGEKPTPKQAEEAARLFLAEMGWAGHQCVYALHADTDNIHLHIAVNRVSPMTQKIVRCNNNFDIEQAHKAVARIEHTQGWRHERNSRYRVNENGEIERNQSDAKQQARPKQKAADYEHHSGEKSVQRMAQEALPKILKEAQTWQEFHKALAKEGLRYEKKGSGALIWLGDTSIKASNGHRDASLSKLQKRFGEYQPADTSINITQRPPEPLHQTQQNSGWNRYIEARKQYYAEKKQAYEELKRRLDAERKALYAQQRERRKRLFNGDWRGRGAALTALKSITAAEQAAERAILREKQEAERQALRHRFGRFVSYEEWLRVERGEEEARKWRYRARHDEEHQLILSGTPAKTLERDIRRFRHTVKGNEVHYKRIEDDKTSFIDYGQKIVLTNNQGDAVLAMLQLAEAKWPKGFEIQGSEQFKQQCIELAAKHHFKITNPELQDALRQAKEQGRNRGPALQR